MMECCLHGADCPLDEEVIVLEAIYINELVVTRADNGHVNEIRLVLHPATADETDRQYVKITLVIKPSENYPEKEPEIVIENSRGLSDSQIKCLNEALNLDAKAKCGWPMLHDLIETAKDTLTAGNVPHCPCAICLDHFSTDDDIHKTTCYHYYHAECLVEYVDYYRSHQQDEKSKSDKLIPCPICREEIEMDITVNVKKKPESSEDCKYVPDAYVRALQNKMQELYVKQKEKGGIIDLEAEKNKFLVQNGTVLLGRDYVEESERRLNEVLDRESSAEASNPISQKRDTEKDNRKQFRPRDRYDGKPQHGRKFDNNSARHRRDRENQNGYRGDRPSYSGGRNSGRKENTTTEVDSKVNGETSVENGEGSCVNERRSYRGGKRGERRENMDRCDDRDGVADLDEDAAERARRNRRRRARPERADLQNQTGPNENGLTITNNHHDNVTNDNDGASENGNDTSERSMNRRRNTSDEPVEVKFDSNRGRRNPRRFDARKSLESSEEVRTNSGPVNGDINQPANFRGKPPGFHYRNCPPPYGGRGRGYHRAKDDCNSFRPGGGRGFRGNVNSDSSFTGRGPRHHDHVNYMSSATSRGQPRNDPVNNGQTMTGQYS